MKFYDNHDIWHFLSAGAMFFSFLVGPQLLANCSCVHVLYMYVEVYIVYVCICNHFTKVVF